MQLKVRGISSTEAEHFRQLSPDANGQPAQIHITEGGQSPCRHCLTMIQEGEEKLVLSYRPFETSQPYAETGPIFLHNSECPQYDSNTLPTWFNFLEPALIRGYDKNDWIRYDTGKVISGTNLEQECRKILGDNSVAYIHIRSKFNCFQCRVDRN